MPLFGLINKSVCKEILPLTPSYLKIRLSKKGRSKGGYGKVYFSIYLRAFSHPSKLSSCLIVNVSISLHSIFPHFPLIMLKKRK